jgi:hypothetical protein
MACRQGQLNKKLNLHVILPFPPHSQAVLRQAAAAGAATVAECQALARSPAALLCPWLAWSADFYTMFLKLIFHIAVSVAA